MKSATERDSNLMAAYVTVAVTGGLLVVGAALSFGARAMIGVAVGALLAVSNLWVLERLVTAYLRAGGGRWAAIATVKAALLLGIVAVLVKTGTVGVLPIVAGFGALPVGILLAGLVPVAAPREGS